MSLLRVSFAIAVLAASSASAASVSISVHGFGSIENGDLDIAAARAAQSAFHGTGPTVVEDFEGFAVVSPSFSAAVIPTGVGDFASINPAGSGSTNLNPTNQLHVRDGTGAVGGRFNTTLGGGNYLDSNDNSGILWTMPGGASLLPTNRLSFLATDIDDVGSATFNIFAGGDDLSTSFLLADIFAGARPDGELLLFKFAFDQAVTDLTLSLEIDKGDGFSIDDLTVSQVPLPAAAWMLLAGVGALAGVARARRRA